MAKNHGARQQKKLAKQKAKRQEKRSSLMKRDSVDPTIRLQRAEKWPVVRALVTEDLWKNGMGYLVLARQEGEGRLVFASYLVDVLCLGVKDAFWHTGSKQDFDDLIQKMEARQPLVPIEPACLVRIIKGAVDYALSFGFRPHPDFRHAAMLLVGIDPTDCTEEFTYGRDGKPLYFQGPHETPQQVRSILQRVREASGHYVVEVSNDPERTIEDLEDDDDDEVPEEVIEFGTERRILPPPASSDD